MNVEEVRRFFNKFYHRDVNLDRSSGKWYIIPELSCIFKIYVHVYTYGSAYTKKLLWCQILVILLCIWLLSLYPMDNDVSIWTKPWYVLLYSHFEWLYHDFILIVVLDSTGILTLI
jgi:hypothetical protein